MAQTINVNTTPGQFMPTLYYSQGDIGREFEIVLASSDGWSIPAGATVEMVATKPSGFGFSVAGTLTDNVASFTTTETMTNEHGRYPAEIRITSNGDVIGTANFYLSGEKDPHPAETIDGDASEIMPELTLLVERVETAASSVLDMTVNASTLSAGSQATYSYDEETNTATFGIPQGEAGAGAAGVTASAYSSSRTYAVGDYVIHNSNLYRCTTAITTAEAFTAAHWTQVVLADDVSDVKSELTDETNARILLAGRVTTAEGDIDTLETHKVAQPLDEYNQPTDGTNGQSLRTKGDGTTEWADVGLPTDAQTAQAVSDWLDEHPEATTTVQDYSLTYKKLAIGTLGFVTPEMFGAKGDGSTDDTQAIQTAISSGFSVLFSNRTYCISDTVIISSPIVILGNDATISQGTFAESKGCFRIAASDVYFYGKFTLQLAAEKTTVEGEGTDNSGIKFYPDAAVSNFYFEDITIKGFIGGIVFMHNTISQVLINRLHVEHVDFGIWGAGIDNLRVIELSFSHIDHSQNAGDPTHVVYLTGIGQTINSKNILIDRCIGEYCNEGTEDSVFSIKCTSNFVCTQLICKHVNVLFATLYASGKISNILADDINYTSLLIQGSCADGNPFVVQDGIITNINAPTYGMARCGASPHWIMERVSFSGTAAYGLYLSAGNYTEKDCSYEDTSNSLSIYAYYVTDSATAQHLITEPRLKNMYLVKYVQDMAKTKFVLNPNYYDGADVSDGGSCSNFEFVPNNVFITTDQAAQTEWFNNNLIVRNAAVIQFRGRGMHIVKNGGGVAINSSSKLVLQGGATTLGTSWQMAWFYQPEDVAYEIAHI